MLTYHDKDHYDAGYQDAPLNSVRPHDCLHPSLKPVNTACPVHNGYCRSETLCKYVRAPFNHDNNIAAFSFSKTYMPYIERVSF